MSYGEDVDMLSHALQAAFHARNFAHGHGKKFSVAEKDELVVAALCHDVGSALGAPWVLGTQAANGAVHDGEPGRYF